MSQCTGWQPRRWALDALPHNGAVITVLGICKLAHKDSYLDIFAVDVMIPMIALLVLASLFGAV